MSCPFIGRLLQSLDLCRAERREVKLHSTTCMVAISFSTARYYLQGNVFGHAAGKTKSLRALPAGGLGALLFSLNFVRILHTVLSCQVPVLFSCSVQGSDVRIGNLGSRPADRTLRNLTRLHLRVSSMRAYVSTESDPSRT
jgi:hypothetical protein